MHKELRLITALLLMILTVAIIADDATTAPADPISTDDLISKGEAQLQQGDLPSAIETLTAAVKREPGSSLARTRLGGAYLLDQQYTPAIDQFQQAISADADNAPAFIGMGIAYLHSGRFGLAKAALDEAKRIDPNKAKEIDEVQAKIDARMQSSTPAGSSIHRPATP